MVSWRSLRNAMTSVLYRAYTATAVIVPVRMAQNPALRLARFQNMPMMNAQNSGTLKKENRVCR